MTPQQHYEQTLRYHAAWLDVSPEELMRLARTEGELVHATPVRGTQIPGFSAPVRVYALRLEGQRAVYLACAPELEARAQRKLVRKFEGKRPPTRDMHQCFWFDSLLLSGSAARALEPDDVDAFVRFHREAYPNNANHDWVPDYARKIMAQGRCFGVFAEGKLVCAADAPDIPYLSETIVEPGIMTLPGYRRRGYAAAACAAFLRAQISRGMTPVWTCTYDNDASAGLAQRLGFRRFGTLWRMERI